MGQKIYVGNLSFKTDNQSLENYFSEYGEVTEARVITDRESGRSRGFGFVTFSSGEHAQAAVSGANGQNLDGRDLRVSEAQEQSRGGQKRF